jgi:hypothetical protein
MTSADLFEDKLPDSGSLKTSFLFTSLTELSSKLKSESVPSSSVVLLLKALIDEPVGGEDVMGELLL